MLKKITQFDLKKTSLIVAFLSLGYYFVKNSTKENLEYDESGQFWMSKGLNHYSDIDSPEGSIHDLILNNRKYNLDPGGFTLILRGWSKISNNIVWLKLLPFIFFLGFCFFLLLNVNLLTSNSLMGILGLIMLIKIDNLFNFTTFLRPYSYEYFGAMIAFYFTLRMKSKQFTSSQILLFGLVLALFTFSRYTFSVIIVASTILLIEPSKSIKYNLRRIFLFTTPIILSYILIWFITLKYQNPSLKAPGLYQNNLLLSHPEIFWDLFKWNLFNIRSISFTVLILLYIFKSKLKIKANFSPLTLLFIKWGILIHITLITFSLFGASPWDIRDQRSAYLYILTIISSLILLAIFLKIVRLNFKNAKAQMILILLLMVLLAYSIERKIGFKRDISAGIVKENKDNNFSMDASNYSSLKYYYKYGILKNINTPKLTDIRFIDDLNDCEHATFPIFLHQFRAYDLDSSFLQNYKYYIITTENKNKSYPYFTITVLTSKK